MKTLSALAVVALLVGCGDTKLLANIPDEDIRPIDRTPAPPPSGDDSTPLPRDVEASLRLRGSKSDAFHAALLRTSELRILADGAALPYTLLTGDLDVAMAGHAWQVARFTIPAGTRDIQVLLDFDNAEGSFVTQDADGRIEAPGIPIYFAGSTELIAQRNKLVLDLDLERSLVETASNVRELVPVFRIDY